MGNDIQYFKWLDADSNSNDFVLHKNYSGWWVIPSCADVIYLHEGNTEDDDPNGRY